MAIDSKGAGSGWSGERTFKFGLIKAGLQLFAYQSQSEETLAR